MVEGSDRPRFTLETFRKFRIRNLDCNETAQARVSSAVNRAHATLAYQLFDSVGSNLSAEAQPFLTALSCEAPRGEVNRRFVHQRVGCGLVSKQRFHFTPQTIITGTRILQKRTLLAFAE